MKKNAVVTCIPVLKWDGGQATGASATFQGEKVEANAQVIPYKTGGHVTMRTSFPFQEGMENSAGKDICTSFQMTSSTIRGQKRKTPFSQQCKESLVTIGPDSRRCYLEDQLWRLRIDGHPCNGGIAHRAQHG